MWTDRFHYWHAFVATIVIIELLKEPIWKYLDGRYYIAQTAPAVRVAQPSKIKSSIMKLLKKTVIQWWHFTHSETRHRIFFFLLYCEIDTRFTRGKQKSINTFFWKQVSLGHNFVWYNFWLGKNLLRKKV